MDAERNAMGANAHILFLNFHHCHMTLNTEAYCYWEWFAGRDPSFNFTSVITMKHEHEHAHAHSYFYSHTVQFLETIDIDAIPCNKPPDQPRHLHLHLHIHLHLIAASHFYSYSLENGGGMNLMKKNAFIDSTIHEPHAHAHP